MGMARELRSPGGHLSPHGPVSTQPARHGEPRSDGLDLARFAASGMVFVAHAAAGFAPTFGLSAPWGLSAAALFGVELFFVLSGLLIGRLLFEVAEHDPTPHGWLIFMLRRWLRTLPVYYLCLLAQLLLPALPDDLPGKLLRYATMTQNFGWPVPDWYIQSWTLAIEEWFYLLFSAVLLSATALLRSRRTTWAVIGLFLAAPLALRIASAPPANFERDMYHVVVMRLDAIAYGVALARLQAGGSRLFRHPWLAMAAGLGLIGLYWSQHSYGIFFGLSATQFQLSELVLVAVGWALVLSGLQRLRIGPRPLVWLVRTGSRISYSLYLSHLTIFVAVSYYCARHGIGRATMLAVALALALLVPYAIYHLFEAPIMALRPAQSWKARAPAPAIR